MPSISSQKRYLESFAKQRGYTNIVHYTDDGWEKQYQYKVGKKKVYMAPSAA